MKKLYFIEKIKLHYIAVFLLGNDSIFKKILIDWLMKRKIKFQN